MKRLKTLAGDFLLSALVLGAVVTTLLFWRGVAANPPNKWEEHVITFAKHRVLVGGRGLNNPLAKSPEMAAEGRQNFAHYCFACHGLDGQNTGVPFSDSMSPRVPLLASREVQDYSDGQLYWVVRNGLWPSGMPAARGILADDEIWTIVAYIRSLPPAGSLGEPRAYSGEECGSGNKNEGH